MPQQAGANTPGNKWQNENSQQKKKTELKNTVTEIKQWKGSTAKWNNRGKRNLRIDQ